MACWVLACSAATQSAKLGSAGFDLGCGDTASPDEPMLFLTTAAYDAALAAPAGAAPDDAAPRSGLGEPLAADCPALAADGPFPALAKGLPHCLQEKRRA